MPGFKFLPIRDASKNDLEHTLVKLFEDEYEYHGKSGIPAKREAQMQLISDAFHAVQAMTHVPDKDTENTLNREQIKKYINQLTELNKKKIELENIAEKSGEQEHLYIKAYVKFATEMKSLRADLAKLKVEHTRLIKRNKLEEERELLARNQIKQNELYRKFAELKVGHKKVHEGKLDDQDILYIKLLADIEKVQAEKVALEKFHLNYLADDESPKNVLSDDVVFPDKLVPAVGEELTPEEVTANEMRAACMARSRSVIVTGAVLHVKNEIKSEYSGRLNALVGYVLKNEPSNSVLYSGIDAAIGVTDENPLTAQDEAEALKAFNQFVASMAQVKAADRKKLKHVETKEKDAHYIYDINAKVAKKGRADLLLDTMEEKERYKNFMQSERAHYKFKSDVAADVVDFNTEDLSSVETIEKHGQWHIKTDDYVAKLPSGKPAKNKTIRDNEDPTHYMGEVKLNDIKGQPRTYNEKDVYAITQKFSTSNGREGSLLTQLGTFRTSPLEKLSPAAVGIKKDSKREKAEAELKAEQAKREENTVRFTRR